MNEAEARAWVRERFGVPRETLLERFATLLRAEAEAQNLIARSTFDQLWSRHLVDSAQLIPLASDAGPGTWLDIGSGAGLPGLVVAALGDRPVTMVEPRARRVEFLRGAVAELGLPQALVAGSRIESFRSPTPAAVISARAVAPLHQLFAAARHCADRDTLWLLPKGRGAHSEVDAARKAWQGSFHVEQSITQSESLIVVAREVHPR